MKDERIYAAIGAADDDLLHRCEVAGKRKEAVHGGNEKVSKKKHVSQWVKYGSLAACLCLIAVGAYAVFHLAAGSSVAGLYPAASSEDSGTPVLQWSEHFAPADYFKYNNNADAEEEVVSDYAIVAPYAETRSFSDERGLLEADGVIPVMDEHPQFGCAVHYNEDGSIYSLVFSWHIRGDGYSDLSITAGYQEVEQITCCISIEEDENGNIIEPAVTVTERDGVQIVAEGNENRDKTITFQNDSGWYQIKGSWSDSYEPMVMLLDWIWEHPVDFERFSKDAGDTFTHTTLDEMPDAFRGYIPDFAAFGFTEEYNNLSLKNGEPYAFAANYVAHADPELVKEGIYSDAAGWTNIHWCINTEPDYYDLQDSLGELDQLTEQAVFNKIGSNGIFTFTWDGYLIWVHTNTPQETWAVLESLKEIIEGLVYDEDLVISEVLLTSPYELNYFDDAEAVRCHIRDISAQNVMKVHCVENHNIIEAYEQNGRFSDNISKDYMIYAALPEEGVILVFTKQDGAWQYDGARGTIGMPAGADLSSIPLSKKEAQDRIDKEFDTISDMKFVTAPAFYVDFVYFKSNKVEYLIPRSGRPDFTNLENGKLYEASEAVRILKSAFSADKLEEGVFCR